VITTASKPIDKYVNEFTSINISTAKNVTFRVAAIVMVLLAASYNCHSINSKAIEPNADTVFYRIDTTIRKLESQLWKQGIGFLREKRRKLDKLNCYVAVDETHDSYTGKLLRKEKHSKEKLTSEEKFILRYIHAYRPKSGDTGSFKYLVFALLYGNKRRVLRVKAIKRKENYKDFVIKTLTELRKEVAYVCVLLDRGFYDGLLVDGLKKHNIPFILRARISDTMKRIFGFYRDWKCYRDFEIGVHKIKADLVLGVDSKGGKRMRWAFITNMEFENWYSVREAYRKRWNIENIFKATDGIQLRAQTNNPTMRLFCVCLSFLFYNAWQSKHKRKITLLDFVMESFESIFELIVKTARETIEFYRDNLRINIPFWNRIISSI
jgi:hypothetical protein